MNNNDKAKTEDNLKQINHHQITTAPTFLSELKPKRIMHLMKSGT